MERTKIAVVGATGMVGQRLLVLLENHPYFEVVPSLSTLERELSNYILNFLIVLL